MGHGCGVCAAWRSNEALLYDVGQEMYFQWAKIAPYLAGFREKMNLPEWMRNIERVVSGSAGGRSRLETMRRNIEEMAKLRRAPSVN